MMSPMRSPKRSHEVSHDVTHEVTPKVTWGHPKDQSWCHPKGQSWCHHDVSCDVTHEVTQRSHEVSHDVRNEVSQASYTQHWNMFYIHGRLRIRDRSQIMTRGEGRRGSVGWRPLDLCLGTPLWGLSESRYPHLQFICYPSVCIPCPYLSNSSF